MYIYIYIYIYIYTPLGTYSLDRELISKMEILITLIK